MKNLLTFLISLFFFHSFAIAGGGPDRFYINCYEPNLNLQYMGIHDTIEYFKGNKKIGTDEHATSNVAIYDITKNQINYVFKDTIKRSIIDFNFESQYIEEFKTIEFNNSYEPKDSYGQGLYLFSNNKNVSKRSLSNSLIIITQDYISRNIIIWICDKYGNNLRKAFEFNDEWKWEIDVKNQMVRISRQVDQKIEIRNEKY